MPGNDNRVLFSTKNISQKVKKQSIKGKWQQNYLSSYLKETPKQYIEVYHRIFISALFGEIF